MSRCTRLHLVLAVLLVPVAAHGQNRTFNLVNLCGERIWVGTLGTDTSPTATTGWQLDPSEVCSSDSQCKGGQTCDTQSRRCQLVLSLPTGLGRLWPMTGCTFNAANQCAPINGVSYNCCATGGCTYGTNSAGQGQWGLNCVAGGEAPLTVAEFSLGVTEEPEHHHALRRLPERRSLAGSADELAVRQLQPRLGQRRAAVGRGLQGRLPHRLQLPL